LNSFASNDFNFESFKESCHSIAKIYFDFVPIAIFSRESQFVFVLKIAAASLPVSFLATIGEIQF